MSITALLQNLSQWDLPLESSLTEKAMLCKVKGDIVGYLLANSSCSFDEQMQAQHIRTCATNEYTTLRRYAEEHNVPFDMHHLSYLKQYNRKAMEHRYSSSPFWCSIARYLNEME